MLFKSVDISTIDISYRYIEQGYLTCSTPRSRENVNLGQSNDSKHLSPELRDACSQKLIYFQRKLTLKGETDIWIFCWCVRKCTWTAAIKRLPECWSISSTPLPMNITYSEGRLFEYHKKISRILNITSAILIFPLQWNSYILYYL